MPNSLAELALMVFLLGIKHGIDPDHLVAIDGLTRFNANDRPLLSRWAGFLFSLGHGVIVIAFAAFLGAAATQHHAQHWVETTGALTSALFLLILGGVNLYGALRTNFNQIFKPIGFRATFLARFFRVGNPFSIIFVGAFFAISFDTLSQAALFAATTSKSGGWQYATVAALLFTFGMMLPDAVNGLWLSKLIARADLHARILSRIIGGVIASLSLTIGTINLIQLSFPSIAARIQEWQLLTSVIVILIATIGFQALLYFWQHHPGHSSVEESRQNSG